MAGLKRVAGGGGHLPHPLRADRRPGDARARRQAARTDLPGRDRSRLGVHRPPPRLAVRHAGDPADRRPSADLRRRRLRRRGLHPAAPRGQGTAWIELSGEISTYELAAGQSLCVHPGHVGAFQATVSFQTTRMPGHRQPHVRRGRPSRRRPHRPRHRLAAEHAAPDPRPRLEPYLGEDHKRAAPWRPAAGGGVLGGMLGRKF